MKAVVRLSRLPLLLYLCGVLVRASLDPLYGESFKTTYNGRGDAVIFPSSLNEELPYFTDNLNFDAIDGKILIGAADKLYVLDKNLSVGDGGEYSWTSSRTCSQQDDRLCRNHIRIYVRPNDDSNSLFVCGTQSGIEPQCRMLNISGSQLIETGIPNPTSLVSAHPDFPGFGEFRNGSASDNVYFSANFKTPDSASFDICYQQVVFNSTEDSVSTSRLYGWQETDEYWLNSPVVFVDYQRIDYGQDNELLQYYFVFLREKQAMDGSNEVLSRVLRLCRNDAGVNISAPQGFTKPPDTQDQIFTSYMKARIFCEREMPPGTQFVGAQDFKYNEMWSAAFNSPTGGRYHENTPYVRMVYGAFSGPRIGPIGTAICAYRADMGNPSSSEGLTGGIFDVFRDDVINPRMRTERENDYLQCRPGGRNPEDSQRIEAVQDVRQIGENPLLVFDGFYATQMVVDQVCVVKRDGSACVNQDVLFVGTSDGRVLKVVFATDEPSGTSSILPIFPVVAEEIKLDDKNATIEMKIETVNSTKQLYVVTSSRIYRLPLEQCSRHQNNITSCIGSRDPYCVWDSREQGMCKASTLSAVAEQQATIPVFIRQNIHTGMVELPEVGFEVTSYTTMEGGRLTVTVVSNEPVEEGVVEVDIKSLTAKVGVNVFSSANPISVTLEGSGSSFRKTFEIEIRQDRQYSGNLQFQLSLRNTKDGAVVFIQQNATVTITDIDGTLFRIGLGNLGTGCVFWPTVTDNAAKLLSTEIAAGIGGGYPDTNIVNATFNCVKNDDNYITFTGVLLAIPTQSIAQLLNSLEKWASDTPKIASLNVIVDGACSVRISSLDSTCEARQMGALFPGGGTSSGATVNGLVAGFIIVFVIASCLVLVVVVLTVVLIKSKKNISCPPSENVKVKPEGNGMYHSGDMSMALSTEVSKSALADRRGSKDLHLDMPEYKPNFSSDTNPRSSDPLLGKSVFFPSNGLNDTVHNEGALEKSPSPAHVSSVGIEMQTSIEVHVKVTHENPEHNNSVSDQPV